jgi:hypothetical protein
MTAVYPGAVRTFTLKQDDITTIDAGDVNALQDEVGAIERTVGVNPLTYAPTGKPTVGYTSLGKRMDSHEATLTSLQDQLNILSFAASNGWSTPVLSLQQGGVTPGALTAGNTTNFTTVTWATPPSQDPGGMWSHGANLLCVLGGWYTISVAFSGPVDVFALNAAQNANNLMGILPVPMAFQRVLCQLSINGAVAATQTSVHPWAPFYVMEHYLNFTWHGALHHGDLFSVALGQYNGGLSGTATIQATYNRALPGVS